MLLRFKRGMTLFEITLTMTVLFLALSVIAGFCQTRMQRARMEQTAKDMTAIAEASVQYRTATGSWPASIGDLAPGYLPQDVLKNAFGNAYVLTCAAGSVSVSSLAPAGLARDLSQGSLWQVSSAGGASEQVMITKREEIGSLGRLRYDKKYMYNE